uniref:Peptidase C1A papain C-terminal domain-containing protein n=1 Tax=Glycine max TaxID=3847 RepID=K7L2V8_SOYBN
MAISLDRKSIVTIFIFFWTCCTSRAMSRTLSESSIATQHEEWMVFHGRVYADSVERIKRQQIFKENLFIEKHNEGNKSLGFHKMRVGDIEPNLHWRKRGAVNNIKNQGLCGICSAFAVVAAVEGITKIKTGKLVSFTDGCHGQYDEKNLDYIQSYGLQTEAEYPYDGKEVRIRGYKIVPPRNEEQLLKAMANQPVAVGVEGVFTWECGTYLNHAIIAIGYNQDANGKYWLIRNSWGEQSGEGGYMKLKRDTVTLLSHSLSKCVGAKII